MDNKTTEKLLSMLSKFSKKDLSEGIQKATEILNNPNSKDIVQKIINQNMPNISAEMPKIDDSTLESLKNANLQNIAPSNSEDLTKNLSEIIAKLNKNKKSEDS